MRCIFFVWQDLVGGLARLKACAVFVMYSLHFVCEYKLIDEPNKLRLYGRIPQTAQSKTKTTQKGGLCFWWEWVDSNHLSRKTTDLQSAPALQLRRTPKTHFMVRAAGIEPAFQAWKACILALELCSPLVFRLCDYILFFYKRKLLF